MPAAQLQARRKPWLEATPPEIIRLRAPICSAEAEARRSNSSTTVRWKEARRSSVGWGVAANHCSSEGWRLASTIARRAAISADRSCASTQRSTAVLSPLKLKSKGLPFILASVNRTAWKSP